MPMPMDYRLAAQDFDQVLTEVVEATGLTTRNQAYTTIQAVLICFRRRLTLREAIVFAQILPAMVRALFVQDWDPDEPRSTIWDRTAMTEEVKALRADHNFSPDTAIRDVASVLRRHVEAGAFEHVLTRLPAPARDFWE
ncbi:DUF2267 domain-containing protein [Prosthecodimorpha staleyi]|uniref:DUF2267 domain-containing protein n=1 Tax=Prosthecodimorpha staleyi TaxID=2840188 RepID=A0A947D698_9HYPH|nr:DUF2267 domain-containing protein [Prosthecodimorpha staleyi]MBT9291520.1 DUF2267 domain-containing protein [Prosthecodimorpha staleyi]